MQLALLHTDRRAGDLFDLTRAGQFFQKALEIDPDSGALLGIGEVALLRGAWSTAREGLQGANADHPMTVAALYLLGYLSWRERRPSEARR